MRANARRQKKKKKKKRDAESSHSRKIDSTLITFDKFEQKKINIL